LGTERIVSGIEQPEDLTSDDNLRPSKLSDYIGQDRLKTNLNIAIVASKQRGEALDHVLLHGPPGLGKTTLANIIANELDTKIKTTSGPAIERPADMVAILTRLQEGDVLFIDEIHRLNRVVEEVLYGAMEDFVVSWVIEKGLKARSMNLTIQPFTLIGATTRFGMVSSPLRDRFGSVFRLDFYENDAMATIVERSARILSIESHKEGLLSIAHRSRGTPRIANRLLRRVRDFAQVVGDNIITPEITIKALDQLEVDEIGLDDSDRLVLNTIIDKFNGGPVGIETVAAAISEEADTIMDVYEPFLLQKGFLDRTRRGRVATPRAYEHLGLMYPENTQSNLFTD
tara:strand:- start:1460 stop:2488 length:1029 start_codon:yes stop_codon:yes gene_type:complete